MRGGLSAILRSIQMDTGKDVRAMMAWSVFSMFSVRILRWVGLGM